MEYPVDRNFKYHKPTEDQASRYNHLRDKAKEYATMVLEFCPDSLERSLALTKLEEAVMWANASIARTEAKSE